MGVVQREESEFEKFLKVRFTQLPAVHQKYFQYGSLLIGLSASTSGLVCNTVFRQTLKIRRGYIISSLIVSTLPLFQTTILYKIAIPDAIMAGKMNCSLCNTLRGTAIGGIVGGLGSASLAALVSTAYFIKYDKRPLPNDLFRFCINLYRPAMMRLKYFFLFQTLLCTVVSAGYYTIYEKMLTPEEEEGGGEQINRLWVFYTVLSY